MIDKPDTRPVLLPATAASVLEAWIHDKRTGYIQLNFTEGTIGNATIHCTVPIQGDLKKT